WSRSFPMKTVFIAAIAMPLVLMQSLPSEDATECGAKVLQGGCIMMPPETQHRYEVHELVMALRPDKARKAEALQFIIKRYPNTPEAKEAAKLLKDLRKTKP